MSALSFRKYLGRWRLRNEKDCEKDNLKEGSTELTVEAENGSILRGLWGRGSRRNSARRPLGQGRSEADRDPRHNGETLGHARARRFLDEYTLRRARPSRPSQKLGGSRSGRDGASRRRRRRRHGPGGHRSSGGPRSLDGRLRRRRSRAPSARACQTLSGEYSMVKAAAERGWIDEPASGRRAPDGPSEHAQEPIWSSHRSRRSSPSGSQDDGPAPSVRTGAIAHPAGGVSSPARAFGAVGG